jgi:DNA-binding phage protein
MTTRTKTSKPFDVIKYLDSDEIVAAYMAEAISTGDADAIARAKSIAEKVRGARPKPPGQST